LPLLEAVRRFAGRTANRNEQTGNRNLP
jgi:hypothetical protein